jgi:flavin reductase (DIM6/NTAB) family NADH-FMN oxidoreductase RutF
MGTKHGARSALDGGGEMTSEVGMTAEARSAASYFAAPSWEPVCAVGAHAAGVMNAQICVSVFGVSIVESMPRLIVVLWKTNYTHELVQRSGTLACTLLTEAQVNLLEPLGMRTGRDERSPQGKLSGLDFRLTDAGDPYFPGGAG